MVAASPRSFSGRCWLPSRARSASARSRVCTSTQPGNWWQNWRITCTCPAPSFPSRCPAAVPASSGASGSPVSARRGPSSAASLIRRPASLRVDQRPLGDRVGQRAAQLLGGGQPGQLIDQRMLGRGQAPAHPLHPLHQDQTLTGGQLLEIQPEHTINRGIQHLKRRGDRVSIHTRILAAATDKNCPEKPLELK